jgi:hypothetical protein
MSNSRFGLRTRTGQISSIIQGQYAPSNDPDAQAFINAAGITGTTQQSAINTLVVSLKANNIWTKLDAIYPMVGGTATTHKFNLKNPADTNAAYRLSFVGGWTHSSTGALPNGTNAYADTFWLSSQQNSASVSFYSRTNTTGLFHEFGAGIVPSTYMLLRYNDLFYGSLNASSDNTVANTNSTGHYLITRTASNVIKFFKNSGVTVNSTAVSTGIPNVNMIISAWRQDPSTVVRYSNRQCSFATLGTGLNDTESANLYTAIQAFQTTLGRQV